MNARALAVAAALGTSLIGGGWVISRGLNVREADFTSARLFDAVFGHVRQFYRRPDLRLDAVRARDGRACCAS